MHTALMCGSRLLSEGICDLVWKCARAKRSDTFRDERGMDSVMKRVMSVIRGRSAPIGGATARLVTQFNPRHDIAGEAREEPKHAKFAVTTTWWITMGSADEMSTKP